MLLFLSQLRTVAKLASKLTYYYFSWRLSGKNDVILKNLVKSLCEESIMYVKIFQAVAGSMDLLSEDVQSFICEYSDNVPYETYENNVVELKEKLNKVSEDYPDLIVSGLSENPIHSGSVSLVYSGFLKDKQVVIKVIRKGVEEKMDKAIQDTLLLTKCIDKIPVLSSFGITQILKENISVLLEQFSMYTELNNLLDYALVCKDNPYIRVPNAYREFTLVHNDILVMELLKGKRVDVIEENEKEEYGYLIAKQAVISIMNYGIYHGDLHRGNILFNKNENEIKQICLLDFGIIGRLTEQERIIISSFYMSLGLGRYDDAVDALLTSIANRNIIDALPQSEQEQLIERLETLAKQCFETDNGFSIRDIYKINGELVKYGLKLAPVFCRIELALAMNASVSRSLETSTTNITTHIKRIIAETFDLELFDV